MFCKHKDASSPGYPEKGVEDLYAAGTAAEWQQGKQEEEDINLAYCEKIAGIQYQPESLQGMKETWERVLQCMACKIERIGMHVISIKVESGCNAHYKPQMLWKLPGWAV